MNPRDKWNTKHTDRMNQIDKPIPNARLTSLSGYLTGGSALDLACGLGGNSFHLGRLNYQVESVDISNIAINYIIEQSIKEQLQIIPQQSDLTELNALQFNNNSFNLVVITYYLDRSIFPFVKSIIKEKGYFFMETFCNFPQIENQGVSNQYKLRSNELLAEFSNWKVLFFEENEQEGRQTIFCQKL